MPVHIRFSLTMRISNPAPFLHCKDFLEKVPMTIPSLCKNLQTPSKRKRPPAILSTSTSLSTDPVFRPQSQLESFTFLPRERGRVVLKHTTSLTLIILGCETHDDSQSLLCNGQARRQ
ncbi:predicted protein [Plenodomus lingam JN3]|uniref:Predicted protein n=1 Tax=Leptosphaeria maculans (strain JN3 / isolate v23.1.3 / race Av1-4-5-6-7-8) TaxID=985895 RepID=E4ZHF6_LEPMJ|nr:predicted protein [Plenodomus lingam JN3]CBX90726.1 predicted protein [Plenodomus lingam JN3]